MRPSHAFLSPLRFHALAAAAAAAGAVACAPAGNDVARTAIDARTEPVYDLRVVDEFKGLASVTGGEAFAVAKPDSASLGPVVDAVAGSFGAVDVAFVVDTTHSMKEKLEALGKDADAVVARLLAKSPGARVAVVSYKDVGEVYTSRVVSDFSDKKDHAVAALRGLRAEGGGDPAEHVYSGLMLAAKKLTWRPDARKAVVLLGDAPPHTGYADGDTREKFVELARTSSLSVYAVALPAYRTDVAPVGKALGAPDMSGGGSGPAAGIKAAPGDISTALDYDVGSLKDLALMASSGGGMLHLSPCPEELPGVIRGAMHAISMRNAGKPLDIVVLLDTSSSMALSLSAARKGVDSAMMDFADKHADVEVGLALYVAGASGAAGTGKVEADLTTDYDKVRDAFWKVAAAGSESGRDFTAAIKTALDSMAWRAPAAKVLLLVTDGQSTPGPKRDETIAAGRGKGVALDTLLVGYNPYDGPFDDSGSAGTIHGDDMDKDPGEVDDLKVILKSFPHGRTEDSTDGKEFEKSLRKLFEEIRSSSKSATGIEVAFVVDATGSMGSSIDALARSHDAMHEFLEGGGRVGVVSFRDLDDDYVARKETDFVSDPHLVLKAFSKISAEGGGDLPEAIYYGLEEATRLSWTPGSKRFLILVTDDVAHRDADKRDAVTEWAKTGDATLYAFNVHFGYDGGSDYVPPEPGYAPDAVAKLFKDGAYEKLKTEKDLGDALDKLLADLGGAKKPEKVDVALVVDTTGSMGDTLAVLAGDKTRYEKFLDKKGLHRIAVIDYKDEGDDWVSKISLPFSTGAKLDDLMKTLKALEASGGGDLPEAMFAALKTATTLGWDAKAKKVIVVITDAEAHDAKKDREAAVEWATKGKVIVRVLHIELD